MLVMKWQQKPTLSVTELGSGRWLLEKKRTISLQGFKRTKSGCITYSQFVLIVMIDKYINVIET